MKDRPSLVVFFVIVGAFFLAGIFCYTQLEIVPDTTWTGPSREVRMNQYAALDHWLDGLGYRTRTVSTGSVETILNGPEKTVFIENSRFNWTNKEQLTPWLRDGGRLIVSLDTFADWRLTEFMETLGGVEVKEMTRFTTAAEEDEAERDDRQNGEDKNNGKNEKSAADEKDGTTEKNKAADEPVEQREDTPSFDWKMNFRVVQKKPEADRVLFMRDRYGGSIKLVKAELGEGWVVFTGEVNFLHNFFIRQNENANLAGELFLAADSGGESGGPDILFIRIINGERHLLGNLAERGNPAALVLSLILLVAAGLWMAIPAFGRSKPEPERPGKPLRERFLAEGRFLAKYHALGKYIELYRKELEQQSRSRGIEINSPPVKALPTKAPPVKAPTAVLSLSFREFIKEQQQLKEQLEEL